MNEHTKARLRHWGDVVYRRTPYPFSKLIYDAGRASLFKEERRESFEHAFAHVARERIAGDYLEFGCYRGASLIMAAKIASRLRLPSMRFFAFDSFAGLPASEGRRFRKGAYSCSLQTFNEYVEKAGVPASRVVPVAGMYDDTLTDGLKRRHQLARAAVVHIDCNLYSSTVQSLAFVEDLLVHGSVLIFDDWYRHEAGVAPDDFGERKAFREWTHRDRCRVLEIAGAARVNKMFVYEKGA